MGSIPDRVKDNFPCLVWSTTISLLQLNYPVGNSWIPLALDTPLISCFS